MKHNGNGNGKGKVEKYIFDDPEGLPIGDGLSIAATGEGDAPTEVLLFCKVPGARVASRFTFRDAELLTDFIEQLIAYRNYVFPDAPEIDTNVIVERKK